MKIKALYIQDESIDVTPWVGRYAKVYVFGRAVPGTETVPGDWLDAELNFTADQWAHKHVENVCRALVPSAARGILIDCFNDARADLLLKRHILIQLQKIFVTHFLMQRLVSEYGTNVEWAVIPSPIELRVLEALSGVAPVAFESNQLPAAYRRSVEAKERRDMMKFGLALWLYPLAIMARMWRILPRRQPPAPYGLGIMLWPSYWQSPAKSLLDQLVAESALQADEILFVSERKLSPEQKSGLLNKGSCSTDYPAVLRQTNPFQYVGRVLWPNRKRLAALIRLGRYGHICRRVAAESMYHVLMVGINSLHYQLRWSLCIQDPGNPTRALAQRLAGINTGFAYLSTNFLPIVDDNNNITQRIVYYSCLLFDRIFSSRFANKIFQENPTNPSHYADVGILLADMVRKARQDAPLQQRIRDEYAILADHKIVCFCDTKVGRAGWYNDAEAAQMIRDVLAIVEASEDLVLLYCGRDPGAKYAADSRMGRVLQELKTHTRARIIEKGRGGFRTQHFLGIADLVISALPTSTGLEGLTGGSKSLFYAPNEKYRYPQMWVNTVPRLCAYGADELTAHVRYWLHECSPEEFSGFLKEFVKSHVDPYCDGQAKQRLAENLNANYQPSQGGNNVEVTVHRS